MKLFRAESIMQEEKGELIIVAHPTEYLKVRMANDLCKQLFDSFAGL